MIPKPPVPISPRVDLDERGRAVDALLPQTQCQRCGYPSCAAYADAIVNADAPINQCPPGGDAGIHVLANFTGRAYQPLNPANGSEAPLFVALIDETRCIGCTLCLQACPVDAIVGANKRMHTVLEDECSGCELCVPVCPVDCISLVAPKVFLTVTEALQDRWRTRHAAHLARYWNEADGDENDAFVPSAQIAIASRSEILARAMAKAKERL